MPETSLGGASCGTGDSAASKATGPVSACIHPEFLYEEFALLLPRDDGPTAALMVKRQASGESTQRVCEVFADINYLREMERIPATAANLEETGLDDVFEPDDRAAVYPLWLRDDCGPSGLLLVKADLDRDPEDFRHKGDEQELALRYLLLSLRDAVRGYETGLMKHMLEYRCPTVAVDAHRRIVWVNRSFSSVMGMEARQMIGADMESILKFDARRDAVTGGGKRRESLTTPVFVVPLSVLITANIEVRGISTPCGPRTLFAFRNLTSEEVIDEFEVGILQKLSELALSDRPHTEVVGEMLKTLASGLSCNLACIVRQSGGTELIVTPHSTRRIHSLGASVLSLDTDPGLKPFFESGLPVVCNRVSQVCGETSFFRQALSIAAFALIPIRDGESERAALLLTWRGSRPDESSQRTVLLRSMANMFGAVLKRAQVLADLAHERDSRRRYTKLVAGREVRMAELKSENAKLKGLIMELSGNKTERNGA